MRVTLVNKSVDNEIKFIADIASICYGKESATNPSKLAHHLNNLGHHSVFEHVSYTFKIEGISRACLAQTTRHRMASFTVESQRYTDQSENICITPESLHNSSEGYLCVEVEKYLDYGKRLYKALLECGYKREDARLILPEGTSTKLYMTINLRSLFNFLELRMHKNSQWEIRNVANAMYDELGEDVKILVDAYIGGNND